MNSIFRIQALTALAICSIASQAHATTLTFENLSGLGGLWTWPHNYGDRVTGATYVPPNYAGIFPVFPLNATWTYGAAGGTTPNVVVDYILAGFDAETSGQTIGGFLYGDLFSVVRGSSATAGDQSLLIRFTADAGFHVSLSAFDIANIVGDRLLPRLQVIGDGGAPLLDQMNVPIEGGTTPGSDFTHFAGTWEAQQLTILLDAPFDAALAGVDFVEAQNRHISRFGIDNITFSQVTGTTAVPETASTLGLLTLSFAGLALIRQVAKRNGASHC